MKKWENRCLRLTAMLAMAVLILTLPACGSSGGGGGGGGGAVTASFATNDPATMTDLVRFGPTVCVGNLCNLDILVGATTNQNYYAFAFDLQLSDPTVARFNLGSDSVGNFFISGSPDSLASQNGNRVVVGVSKSSGVAGNGTPVEATLVSLQFQLLKVGSTTVTFQGIPSTNFVDLGDCQPTGPTAIEFNNTTQDFDCITTTTFSTLGGVLSGS